MNFEDARAFFDGKNRMYSLKKEVAVLNNPPYFAYFPLKYFIGGFHNYKNFQENYSHYLDLIKKTPRDHNLIPRDNGHNFFGILLEKGYFTSNNMVLGFRKLTPWKTLRHFREKKKI